MVREGRVEALEARFRGGRTPEELRLLAVAAANQAARLRDQEQRHRAFRRAEARYLTWISAAERDREVEWPQRVVNGAVARVAFAAMILTRWATVDLDTFEITAGKGGDSARLVELLLKARDACEQVLARVQPLADELRSGGAEVEDRYLALGIYDAVPGLLLDARFHLAWANLYLSMVDAANVERRTQGLRAAERTFQELIDSGRSGENIARCLLGLALTLREQQRYDDARRHFELALGETEDGALRARIVYELARSELGAGRFDEARRLLRPLLKDPDELRPDEQAALLYVNLAHLWEANSHLLEAVWLEKSAATSPAPTAVLLRAKQAREVGLRKMNELAGRGGSWPGLVQLFVADVVDPEAPKETLSPAELLFAARQLSQMRQYRHALEYLKEAARRSELPRDLAGETLFELGVCHYRCLEKRAAAEAFERLARELPSDGRAAQAIGYAYQLWAEQAERTGRPEDYLRVADVLTYLLDSFPDHEQRSEALWWLPIALQAAGRYRDAARRYHNVPPNSPHWEEACYRAALCERLLFEAERGGLSPEALQRRADQAVERLATYAREALARADSAADPAALRRWSAAALVSAAELLVSPGVERHQRALELLAGFEQRYPDSPELGRVLAARIEAYRGLRQPQRAAEVVAEFLHAVSPEQAGPTLATVARGLEEEVERLEREGKTDAARQLATQALATFEQLQAWVEADPARVDHREAVWYGLARMNHLAGRYQDAATLVRRLLAADPRNGDYRRLRALVLTASLPADATPQQLAAACEAWAVLLRDPGLRTAHPQRYWEARCHLLELLLRQGRAAEVEAAIRQERIWYPDLAGPWDAQLEELYQQALRQLGRQGPASGPTGTPQPRP